MTKADIVDMISKETKLSQKDTKAVVDGFISTIITSVGKGNKVELRGFGSFQAKKRQARIARNPRTGETVQITERNVPHFKCSKEFGIAINEAKKAE